MPKYRGAYRSSEPNILGRYFDEDYAIHHLIAQMREGILTGHQRRFKPSLLEKAAEEVRGKKRELDRLIYPLANDFCFSVYSAMKDEALNPKDLLILMMVDGYFYSEGNDNLASTLAIDVSPNAFFKDKGSHQTIDDRVTFEETYKFLHGRQFNQLKSEGYQGFRARTSAFYYLDRESLGPFYRLRHGVGELDVVALASYLYPVQMVNGKPVDMPTRGDYIERAPLHIGYRFKHSLLGKTLRKLFEPAGEIYRRVNSSGKIVAEEGVVKDWLAFRVITKDEAQMVKIAAFLETVTLLGQKNGSEIRHVLTEPPGHDVDKKIKNTTVFFDARSKGSEWSVVEAQSTSREWHHHNEYESKQSRREAFERKQNHTSREHKRAMEYYGRILANVFGRKWDSAMRGDEMEIPFS